MRGGVFINVAVVTAVILLNLLLAGEQQDGMELFHLIIQGLKTDICFISLLLGFQCHLSINNQLADGKRRKVKDFWRVWARLKVDKVTSAMGARTLLMATCIDCNRDRRCGLSVYPGETGDGFCEHVGVSVSGRSCFLSVH